VHIGLAIYGTLDLPSGGFLYDRQVVQQLEARGDRVSVVTLPWRAYQRGLLDNWDEALAWRLACGEWEVLVEDELAHPSLFRTNRRVHQLTRRRFPIISLVHLLHTTSQPWPPFQRQVYRLVERAYLRSLDGGIYVSQYTQRQAETLAGRRPPGVVAYPAGDHLAPDISMEAIRNRAQRPGPLEIVFLGSVIRRKAPHTVLQALAELPKIEWRLRVIGSLEQDPVYAGQLQQQIFRLPEPDRVQLSGARSADEVSAALATADVLVLPSTSEGYAIAYLEAMAFGVPVIATSASGAVELVQPGENGFLVAPGDAQAVAGHLRALAQNPRLRVTMSLAARQTYLHHPTWAVTAEHIHNFLTEQIADFHHSRSAFQQYTPDGV
jgi:glycosyltransferase involved in cell wall biosynthesis